MPKERGDTGRFVQTTTTDDVLAVFDQVRGPVITTGDVADHLDVSRETARRKLGELYDQKRVDRRKRDTHVYYWRVDDDVQDGQPREDIAARGSSPAADDAPAPDPAPVQDQPADVDDDVQAQIDALDLPGSGETLAARRDAIRRLYDYLQDQGTAQKSDFLDQIDADAVGYASAGSFWSNCVKGRDSLKSLPGVDAPGEGEHTWRFRGV